MFPIQYFQIDPLSKTSIQWLVLLINTILCVTFCYGWKMYLMIFDKEKNTREYVKAKTFELMQSNSKVIGR